MDLQLALLTILTGHFFADFILQSDWMAINKSKSWYALGLHVLAYGAGLFGFALVAAPLNAWAYMVHWALIYTLVTCACHFVQDAITSRWTSKLWFIKTELAGYRWRGNTSEPAYWVEYLPTRHWFFVVIGFDQLLHALQLGFLLRWMYL